MRLSRRNNDEFYLENEAGQMGHVFTKVRILIIDGGKDVENS